MIIRRCTPADHEGWQALRLALWPDCAAGFASDCRELLGNPQRFLVLTIHDADGKACGFAEASLRSEYVNGTQSSPVAFLEGLYVLPSCRRQGLARRLAAEVERWALGLGCSELASDSALDNRAAHRMHQALGFAETERVVCFSKPLS